MKLSSKAVLPFDPLPVAAAADATGVIYTTPAVHRYSLGGLAGLDWLRASARVAVRLNQSSAAGTAIVRLKTANGVVHQETVELAAGQNQDIKADLDLSLVSGGALMRWEVEMDSAADASTTAQVFASIEIESPFVVSGC